MPRAIRGRSQFKSFKPLRTRTTEISTYFGMRDRRRYLHWVFEANKRFGLCVLDYNAPRARSMFKALTCKGEVRASYGRWIRV